MRSGIAPDELTEAFQMEKKRTRAYEDDNDLDPQVLKDEVRDLMSKNGFSRIGSGDFRVAYANEDVVAKLAWNRLGIKENKSELRNWERYKDREIQRIRDNGTCKARNYLAELYECDQNQFGWILMERVQDGSDNVTGEEAQEVRTSLSNAGIEIDEIKPYNMGKAYRDNISERVPVVFDYGGT